MNKFARNPYNNKSYKFTLSKGGRRPKGTYSIQSLKGKEVKFVLPPQRMHDDDLENIKDLWIMSIYNGSYFFAKTQRVPRNQFNSSKNVSPAKEGSDTLTENTEGREAMQHQPQQLFRCLGHYPFRTATLQNLFPQRFSSGTNPDTMVKGLTLHPIKKQSGRFTVFVVHVLPSLETAPTRP